MIDFGNAGMNFCVRANHTDGILIRPFCITQFGVQNCNIVQMSLKMLWFDWILRNVSAIDVFGNESGLVGS